MTTSTESGPPVQSLDRWDTASLILAVIALWLVLDLHILSVLLSALLVYELVDLTVPSFRRLGANAAVAKTISIAAITLVVAGALLVLSLWLGSFIAAGGQPIQELMSQMAVALEHIRPSLPQWAADLVPADLNALKVLGADWLRSNSRQVASVGQDVGRLTIHIIIGIAIGALIAFSHEVGQQVTGAADRRRPPLADAARRRCRNLAIAFRQVVFSQVRISAVNTALTGFFLAVVMPTVGAPLPLTKTLIVVTFVVGLLPVIGNLISNTAIALVALSVSPYAAAGALAFLIVIHKLEYFLNAAIIGSRIHARAWELLLAMIVMEAAFGVAGLIAAPVFYAFAKLELRQAGMI